MQPQIVILDETGASHAVVTAANWWKALGQDGDVSTNATPELRFQESEKTLEIKLASRKIVWVNTDSGEISVRAN